MTYYYDSEAKVLLAVDPETEDVRILEPIHFEEDEPVLKTVKVKPLPVSTKKAGGGCPECGSKSKHKSTCSKSSNYAVAKPTKEQSSKMSPLDFEVVKEQQRDEATTDNVAKRFDLDTQEVVDAYASDSYRTYKVL
jgi:hypothetical protein